MLQIGICDDESGARESLQLACERVLREQGDGLRFYAFSSGEGVLRWLEKHPDELDILFLDIEMGGVSGMEAAKRIRERNARLVLVFVTGYADYVFDGYSVNALDYVLKPCRDSRLQAVLRRALGQLHRLAPEVFTIKNADGIFRVPKAKILYLKSDRRLLTLVTGERSYTYYGRLDEAEQALGAGFLRLHQRYLARADAIERIEGASAWVGGEALPISRANHQKVLLAFARGLLRGGEEG